MVTLTTHFLKKWWYKLLKCVSPPLVGAVLVLCSGLDVYAASTYKLQFIFNDGFIPDTVLSSGQDMAWFKSDGSALPYKAMTYKGVYAYIPNSDAGDYAYNPVIVFSVNGNEFRQYPISRTSTADMDTYYYGDITVPVVTGSDGRFRCRFWLEVYPPITSVPAQQTLDFTVKISDFVKLDKPIYDSSTEQLLDKQNGLIQDQINQDNNFHEQDKNDATNAGSDMQGMATDLETVKSKWEILWYPIEFTNRVMGAFQGSSSARYASAYADVSGYRYDEDSGLLEPIVLNTRSSAVARANSGTMIHIPAYTLPVLDVQIWEGADYDLSTLKEQFPDAFNLLYVVVTVLEVMWFVSFLRDKYEEVFG